MTPADAFSLFIDGHEGRRFDVVQLHVGVCDPPARFMLRARCQLSYNCWHEGRGFTLDETLLSLRKEFHEAHGITPRWLGEDV